MADSVGRARGRGCKKESLNNRASKGTKCVKPLRPRSKTACSPGTKRFVKKAPKRRVSKSPNGKRGRSCSPKAPKRRRSNSAKSKAPKRRRSRSSSKKSVAPKRRRSRSSSTKCKAPKRRRSRSSTKTSVTSKRGRSSSRKSKGSKGKDYRRRRGRSASYPPNRVTGSPSGCRSPSKPVSGCPSTSSGGRIVFKKPVGAENRKLPPGVFVSYYLDLLKKAQKEAGRNGKRPQITVMVKTASDCWKKLDEATKERYRKKYCAELKRIKRRQAGGGSSC